MAYRFLVASALMTFGSGFGCHQKDQERSELTKEPIEVLVGEKGYRPSSVPGQVGKPLKLSFLRVSSKGCGEKIHFPALNIERDLPLGVRVDVQITPERVGNINFTCGMGMYRGSIVAE